jgi:hypothetical protein
MDNFLCEILVVQAGVPGSDQRTLVIVVSVLELRAVIIFLVLVDRFLLVTCARFLGPFFLSPGLSPSVWFGIFFDVVI